MESLKIVSKTLTPITVGYVHYQGWRSRGPASVSRPASRPNFNGLGLRLSRGCPCLGLGLGLGGPGFVYRVSRTGLGLQAGLET